MKNTKALFITLILMGGTRSIIGAAQAQEPLVPLAFNAQEKEFWETDAGKTELFVPTIREISPWALQQARQSRAIFPSSSSNNAAALPTIEPSAAACQQADQIVVEKLELAPQQPFACLWRRSAQEVKQLKKQAHQNVQYRHGLSKSLGALEKARAQDFLQTVVEDWERDAQVIERLERKEKEEEIAEGMLSAERQQKEAQQRLLGLSSRRNNQRPHAGRKRGSSQMANPRLIQGSAFKRIHHI